MPTFETPGPISVTIELLVGDALITAGERADTVVDVRPTDESSEQDVKAAAQTRVDYSDGRLLIRTPKNSRHYRPSGGDGSVDVRIELPAGSQIHGKAALAALRCEGRLGECRLSNAAGDIELAQTGALHVNSASGDITVDRADGDAYAVTAAGAVRIRAIGGTGVIKSSSGDTWVGEAGGDLRVNAANGGITVDHARSDLTASTASGDIRVGEVVRGAVSAKTAYGEVEIGVRDGTAAWLDAHTQFGTVHNYMDSADPPASRDDTVEVRARTSFGDIIVRHS